MTVSDTRDSKTDKTGPWLREAIAADGHCVVDHAIIPDEVDGIRACLRKWIAHPQIHAIIATGGTGLTGRDVTPEAFRGVYEKDMDGFAAAGIAGGTYLLAIPGSSGGCRDAWNAVLRIEFDRTHGPCNLVELIPRLTEQ
jgi:molybdenum cofactor biosynthesis protein B